MTNPKHNGHALAAAKTLVKNLEADNEDAASQAFTELGFMLNGTMYNEVGRLTREVHDSLKTFLQDERVPEMAEVEIPNAAERLRYVVRMTEQAANRTLTSVENSLPLAEQLSHNATEIREYWERCTAVELSEDSCRVLSGEVSAFCTAVKHHSDTLYRNLSDVQMAQSFQDLTGQIILRVITLVGDVENKLVNLIKLVSEQGGQGGRNPSSVADDADDSGADADRAPQGPVVPGVDRTKHVSDQDEVDDILSNLGF